MLTNQITSVSYHLGLCSSVPLNRKKRVEGLVWRGNLTCGLRSMLYQITSYGLIMGWVSQSYSMHEAVEGQCINRLQLMLKQITSGDLIEDHGSQSNYTLLVAFGYGIWVSLNRKGQYNNRLSVYARENYFHKLNKESR